MSDATITFRMTGYWHIGSGTGSGASLDALVLRNRAGLPFIPGRSVKGLLREAVQQAEDFGQLNQGTTVTLFGDPGEQDDRFGTVPGTLYFGNASLGESFDVWAARRENSTSLQQLFRELSFTAIDEKGLAVDKSLRRIELTIPLSLKASVQPLDKCPEAWMKALKTAVPLLRRLGSHRQRGFGRVCVGIEEVTA